MTIERKEQIEKRINKIFRNYNTPGLREGAQKEFDKLHANLNEEEKQLAKDCWGRLSEEHAKKMSNIK